MSASSVNYSNSSSPSSLNFVNLSCRCGKRAAVKISESEKNKNKLYYCCSDHSCGYFAWCVPNEEPMTLGELPAATAPNRLDPNTPMVKFLVKLGQFKEKLRNVEGRVKRLESSNATKKTMLQIVLVVIVISMFVFLAK